jgi:hypothetical protein
MKQLLYTLLFVSSMCFSARAQIQESRQLPTTSQDAFYAEKMSAVRSCEELNEQLTKMFGKDYTILEARVVHQLEKNIADKNASRCVRKKSLYGIYGEDYINKLHLINDTNPIPNNKN